MKSPKDLRFGQSMKVGALFSAQKHLGQAKANHEAAERRHRDFLREQSLSLAEAAKVEMPWPSTAEMTLPE